MTNSEHCDICKQVADLRCHYTQWTDRGDVQRMRDAADTIEDLLRRVETLSATSAAMQQMGVLDGK